MHICYGQRSALDHWRRSTASSFEQAVLDAVDLPLLVLDERRHIVFANATARSLAASNASDSTASWVNLPYDTICDLLEGPDANHLAQIQPAIQTVLAGESDRQVISYTRTTLTLTTHHEVRIRKIRSESSHVLITHHGSNSISAAEPETDFERLFEHSANEIFLGDITTMEIIWANTRVRENLGFTLEEIANKPALHFLEGIGQGELQALLAELVSGTRTHVELRATHRRKNHTIYPVSAQLQVIDWNHSKTLLATVKELTDEAMLRQELTQARVFLESAPDATVVVDESGLIVATNSQTQRLLGYSREEIIGQPVETLIPKRYRKTHHQHRTRFFAAPQVRGMGSELTLFAQPKSGPEIPIEVSLSPMIAGTQQLVAAALRDISQRLLAEKALRDSETRYRELFENTSELRQSFDGDGRIKFVNPAWLKAMRYQSSELHRLRFIDLVAPQHERYARRLGAKLQAGGTVKEIQLTYLKRNGEEIELEGNATWQVIDGKQISSQGIFHDVTKRNRNEAELRRAKQQADQATAGKSRFLAAASHDLRQPLQALRLYTAVLSRRHSDHKTLEVTGKIDASLEIMSELLDALLDISRLERGAIKPAFSDVSVRDILQNIFSSNLPQAEQKGLILELAGGDFTVRSDPGLLTRIIDNFVSNAIRYTESGAVYLDTQCQEKMVSISVRDSGVGIPPDQLDRVFEEYYQLENAARDRRKGLGLGLAIVKNIADLLNHSVSVTSVQGQGSSFSVQVPLAEPMLATPDEHRIATTTQARTQKQAASVLLVDDDPTIIDAMVMLLESNGLDVLAASDAATAIDMLDNKLPLDLLISDYRLTGQNGVEIAQHASALYGNELPIIIMTGDTNLGELETSGIENCELLRKPVNTDTLLERISKLNQTP